MILLVIWPQKRLFSDRKSKQFNDFPEKLNIIFIKFQISNKLKGTFRDPVQILGQNSLCVFLTDALLRSMENINGPLE